LAIKNCSTFYVHRNRVKHESNIREAHILAGFTEKRTALNIEAKILIYEAKMFEN